MTALVAHTDPLLVSIDQTIAGYNYKDNRTIWHGLSDITFSTGGISGSIWYKDFGPKGDPDAMLEPRAFCTKGQADFAFTGTTLIIRLNTAFSWYTGCVVTIDGVAPSTLGLLTAVDTLSCDSATYQLTGDAYLDVLVADGLTNAAHTCTLVINSSNAAKFFSMSGFKVGTLTSQPINRTGAWLVPTSNLLPQNQATITITNNSTNVVVSPTLTFPSGLVDASGNPLSPLTAASLSPAQTLTQTVTPVFSGNEVSGNFTYNCPFAAQYVDPSGTISNTVTVNLYVGNVALTVSGTWFTDNQTPTTQERIFTTSATATLEFTFIGDALSLTVQQASSWGVIGVYASDNTTLLNSVTCNANVAQTLATFNLTGFGAGSHTVILRKTTNDGAFIVFVGAAWTVTENYSQINETVTLVYSAQQPYAMPVQNVSIGAYDATFDVPLIGTKDYTGTPVRQNTDLVYTEVLTRFPTFAVFYQRGQRDLLSQYDILIVDPLGAAAADVLYWQSLGIKVFGYISSGEEVGFYQNRYDFTSPLAPNTGDGLGPGGTAGYYMYTKNPSSGPPDQDGVWASYYTNPDPAYGWPDRLQNYYAPLVLGGPQTITNEVVTTKTATITAGSVLVFDTAHSPIDEDQPITLTTMDGSHTYTTFRDYTFDVKTGAFVLSTTISPAVTNGQQLKISYTRKGHTCDGVFFDTVDTPDVYGSTAFGFVFVPGYATNFANMINTFKANNPSAWLISNRGFTILPNIIQSCKGVMFESWLTLPTDINNLATTTYSAITDPATVTANDQYNSLLRTLRLTHEFDVFSLNYCQDTDDALRAYCRTMDAERGYLSWQTTILLNAPSPNLGSVQALPGVAQSTTFQRYKIKTVPIPKCVGVATQGLAGAIYSARMLNTAAGSSAVGAMIARGAVAVLGVTGTSSIGTMHLNITRGATVTLSGVAAVCSIGTVSASVNQTRSASISGVVGNSAAGATTTANSGAGAVPMMNKALYYLSNVDPAQIAANASDFDVKVFEPSSGDGSGTTFVTSAQVSAARGGKGVCLAYFDSGGLEPSRYYYNATTRAISSYPVANQWGEYDIEYWTTTWLNVAEAWALKAYNAGFDGIYCDVVDAYGDAWCISRAPAIGGSAAGTAAAAGKQMIAFLNNLKTYCHTNLSPNFLLWVNSGLYGGDTYSGSLTDTSTFGSSPAYTSVIDGMLIEEVLYSFDGTSTVSANDSGSRATMQGYISAVTAANKPVSLVEYVGNGTGTGTKEGNITIAGGVTNAIHDVRNTAALWDVGFYIALANYPNPDLGIVDTEGITTP